MKTLLKKLVYHPKVARRLSCLLATIHQKSYTLLGAFASASEGGLHPKHRLIRYHIFFIDNVSENDTVLDVGCGNGALLKDVVSKTKAPAVGVEISLENVEAAKRRTFGINNIEIINCDIWEYKDNRSFDVIMLSNVLEHLEERVKLLKHLKEQFKPKKIIIRVPMFERDWLVPYKKELGIEWRLDNTHKVEYTESEFKREMEEAGFSIKIVFYKWGEVWAVAVPNIR